MAEVSARTSQYTLKISGQEFQILRLSTYEEVSQLFEFTATVFSDNASLDIAGFLRKEAEISVAWGDKQRSFSGLVVRFSQVAGGVPPSVDEEFGEYEVQIVPSLWQLTERATCRIFQDMSADAIISKVLDDAGLGGKYEKRLTKSYPAREYCTQYRETDFAFVSRLMEEEGMFYFFLFDGSEDKLVIADDNSKFVDASPDKKVKYKAAGVETQEEVLTAIEYHEEVYSGKDKLEDFDYRQRDTPLGTDDAGDKYTDLQIYDYHPERYRSVSRGKTLATVRRQSYANRSKIFVGYGPWRSASAGRKFTLEVSYRGDLLKEWIIVGAWHSATQMAGSGVSYQTWIEAIPTDLPYKPSIHTPRPKMGPQTAKVVGPEGDEIYMDDLGRAKVQFHWDLEGEDDENSSCWIRVAQPFAGIKESTQKKHGFQWHPLIDDEVVVAFLEGDPDKPLIVGSVYNDVETPLIAPDELIRQMILTRYQHRLLMDDKNGQITLNTGGRQQQQMTDKRDQKGWIQVNTSGNQLMRMEDDQESVGNVILLKTSDGHALQLSGPTSEIIGGLLHSEKMQRVDVNDHHQAVRLKTENAHVMLLSDKERKIEIKTTGGHRITMDDADQSITIVDSSGSHTVKIDTAGNEVSVTTGGDMKFEVAGDFSVTVGGGFSLSAGGKISAQAGSELDVKTGSNATLTVGGSLTQTVASSVSQTAGGSMTQSVGGSLTVSTGSSLSVQAGGSATIMGGASVTIQAGASVTTTAPMVTSQAAGINTIQGALVKIN